MFPDADTKLSEEEVTKMRKEFIRNQKNLAAVRESIKKTMREGFDDIVEEVYITDTSLVFKGVVW